MKSLLQSKKMLNLSLIKLQLLQQIKYYYGLNIPRVDLLESYFENKSNDDLNILQQNIIHYILNDKTLCLYKPYRKYQRNFIKSILNIIEGLNDEVDETLFKLYIDLLNDVALNDEEKYFLVFYSKVY